MDDLIRRQDVIDAIVAWTVEDRPDAEMPTDLVGRIRGLPSAQPEPQWILCSERLPEKPNMYTVTDSKGDVARFVFTNTESSREYWLRCAKAWMPLPEPWRGEELCMQESKEK